MPSLQTIIESKKIQDAAKSVLARLPYLITPDDTEESIAGKAHMLLTELGYPNTWYYDCPALVLLGSRSCLSVSGRLYQAETERVGGMNMISVDLSPLDGEHCGNFSRSYAFEFGKYVEQAQNLEFKNGLRFVENLQKQMRSLVRPQTTFDALYRWANVRIRESGFVNLDYRTNVGHSITPHLSQRSFIQADNQMPLCDAGLFSFEPFVRLKGGHWGFKHEDTFFISDDGQLELL